MRISDESALPGSGCFISDSPTSNVIYRDLRAYCLILTQKLGMTTLVEAHDMDVGFPHAGYCLLGINNRNLETMTTDINHTIRMVDVVEDASIVVSESGITKPADLDKLRIHGIHIVLVGESLMKQPDPGKALSSLIRMNSS